MSSGFPPACSTAFQGSVISTSSTPSSATRNAMVCPFRSRAMGASPLLRVDGPLELGLRHRGAALDAALLGLVVELGLRASLGPVRARPLAAPAGRGHVAGRRLRRRPRLA